MSTDDEPTKEEKPETKEGEEAKPSATEEEEKSEEAKAEEVKTEEKSEEKAEDEDKEKTEEKVEEKAEEKTEEEEKTADDEDADDDEEGDAADGGDPNKLNKRKERLEQNRISARESRKRKKTMIEELQRTVITLSRENKDLNDRNEQLRSNLMEIGTKVSRFLL